MNKVLKIAQVIGNPTGGVMSCVMNYFRNIDRTQVQFDFFTYGKSSYDDEILSLGGRIFTFPNVFKPGTVGVLKKMFAANGYDIVHSHMTTRSYFVLKAAKKAGVKVRICHAHSTAHPSEGLGYLAKCFLKPLARKYATHFAGCSNYSNQWLFGKNSDAYLMKNAVDLARFSDEKCREKDAKTDTKTVGFVGRLVHQKNPEFVLKVYRELTKIRSDTSLVIVGEGKKKSKLQRLASSIKNGSVSFRPEGKNVQEEYKKFDAFLLPSRYEGLPLVAVEAQLCGVKCLLSCEITPDAQIGGEVVFLPPNDAKLWAKTLDRMLNEPPAPKIDRENCTYNIVREAPRLLQFYYLIAGKEKEENFH